MVVASWKEVSCNSFFFLLSKAQPSSRLQQMIPRGQQFSLEAAAEGLIQMWKEFTPEPAQRKEQATKIREWCVQAEEKMVAEALERGMERNMDQTAGGSLVPGAGAWLPQGARPQAFVRTDTNEECVLR
jgi:hypothetical protein